MATATLKRPREEAVDVAQPPPAKKAATKKSQSKRGLPRDGDLETQTQSDMEKVSRDPVLVGHPPDDIVVQLVTGSYDRVLHGLAASIPTQLLDDSQQQKNDGPANHAVSFSDTFLFAAHTSSIRCLALSPETESNKRFLATGSTDERVNLYTVSTSRPATKRSKTLSTKPSLIGHVTRENPLNRSLGSLNHHSRPITTLSFPSKSKLFTAAEDNTVAITRTRDWTMLSSIKAPIPNAQGRPSGDTAAPGEVPAGVNDIAIHPSQKLMLTVGQGERCMRLWNLMTGKKAAVLSFERDVLTQAGEGKWSRGEGRSVLWSEDGEMFVVGFERGAVIYGVDSKPKAVVRPPAPSINTKLHRMRFLPKREGDERDILAISTEDGRVLFYDASSLPEEVNTNELPRIPCLAHLGGREAGITNRVKDFVILQVPADYLLPSPPLVIASVHSDGNVRLWTFSPSELEEQQVEAVENGSNAAPQTKQVGRLLGAQETGNRITCLGAFVMDVLPLSTQSEGDVLPLHSKLDRPDDDESASDDEDDDGEEEFEGLADDE